MAGALSGITLRTVSGALNFIGAPSNNLEARQQSCRVVGFVGCRRPRGDSWKEAPQPAGALKGGSRKSGLWATAPFGIAHCKKHERVYG